MKSRMRIAWGIGIGVLSVLWAVSSMRAEDGTTTSSSDSATEQAQTEPAPEATVEPPAPEPVTPEVFESTDSSEPAAESVAEPTQPSAELASSDASAVDGLISVDFKDAEIRQVLRIVAIKSGVDIVAGKDVEGLVTIKLTNIPWEQALDIILRTYGFTYERKGRIIRVLTVNSLEQEALSTEVFPLNYAKAKDVPDVITEMLSDRGKVRFDDRTNTIIVTDVPSNVFQIREVIERVDQRTPQVLIESRIVETKLEKDENLGLRWSDSAGLSQTATTFGSSFPFPADSSLGSLGNSFLASPVTKSSTVTLGTLTGPTLSLTLNALKQRSDTRIISNPSLAVLNNQEARIHIGEEFPVPTFSVDPQTGNTTVSGFEKRTIGTILKVTPHVNPSQEIVVDLEPEVISVGSNATFQIGSSATVSLPRFNTQTVKTQVRIASGETIAIGGLVKTLDVSQENKVPFLGDLPLIGAFFRNTHRFGGSTNPTLQQDLLIFLTVDLMEDSPPASTVASTAAAGGP